MRTSGASNAARTTAYAARGARPPTWMPPIVTPCGSTLGVGLGFGFGFGAVVVVDVVAVVVAVVVVSVVDVVSVGPVIVGGGS